MSDVVFERVLAAFVAVPVIFLLIEWVNCRRAPHADGTQRRPPVRPVDPAE
jgi:hypothetical protein